MTTDRELMQQALDLLDDINQCSLPPVGIPLPAEIDHVMEALRARLEKWTPEDMAYRPGGLSQSEPKPVAWVRNLTDPQPHCVTDLKYMSAADTDAGVQYVPLYTAPEHSEQWWRHEVSNAWAEGYEKGRVFCGCGDQIMPDDGAECGNCVTARNAVKPQPAAQVHVAEDYHPHVIWAEGINAACFDQEYLYITPPQREFIGLTDEEVKQLWKGTPQLVGVYSYTEIAREIEAKLKEKNNA